MSGLSPEDHFTDQHHGLDWQPGLMASTNCTRESAEGMGKPARNSRYPNRKPPWARQPARTDSTLYARPSTRRRELRGQVPREGASPHGEDTWRWLKKHIENLAQPKADLAISKVTASKFQDKLNDRPRPPRHTMAPRNGSPYRFARSATKAVPLCRDPAAWTGTRIPSRLNARASGCLPCLISHGRLVP